MAFPLQYYHNVTVNTVTLLETMQRQGCRHCPGHVCLTCQACIAG
jgi:UDP-glucose 4-epimerase